MAISYSTVIFSIKGHNSVALKFIKIMPFMSHCICIFECSGWGNDTLKPVWWPHQSTLSDVNNNPHPRRNDLLIIMQHFREWKKSSWGHPAIMTMRGHVSVTTLMQ